MAELHPRVTSNEVDGQEAVRIKTFAEDRKHDRSRGSAHENLLNDAVAVHVNKSNHGAKGSQQEDDESGISATLRRKVEELDVSRKKFTRYLSLEQKQCIAQSPNTTEAILVLIDCASYDWCTRSESSSGALATLKSKFHKTCASLDQHIGLLKMLPKESEYVSVFYGALTSIVAASVMHQAMATGLPKIVDELNAIISDVAKKIELYPQARRQMRRVLIELYTRIFDLLARLMKWYSKHNHYWKLMKKDCYSDFEQDLQGIRSWMEIVDRGAWNNLVIELRKAHDDDQKSVADEQKLQQRFREDMLEAAGNFYDLQQNIVMQQAVQQEQLSQLSSKAYQEHFADLVMERFAQYFHIMGASQTDILTGMMSSPTDKLKHIATHAGSGEHMGSAIGVGDATQSFLTAMNEATRGKPPDMEVSPVHEELTSKHDIEVFSRVLDAWYSEGQMISQRYSQRSSCRPVLFGSVTAQISRWLNECEPRALCIQMPFDSQQTSIGSEIASYMVLSAWEAKYPIVSHFCSLPRQVAAGRSSQTVALSEMIASITRQLVLLLPSTLVQGAKAIDEARFSNLDGTLRTWDATVSIFAHLLSLMTQPLLIVLHGLQLLDAEVTTPLLRGLLDIIRKQMDEVDRSGGGTIKVLFVTDGQARALIPWLRRGEHFIYEGVRQ